MSIPSQASRRRLARFRFLVAAVVVLMLVGSAVTRNPTPSETLVAAGAAIPEDVGVCLDAALRGVRTPGDFDAMSVTQRTQLWRALSDCDPVVATTVAVTVGHLDPGLCDVATVAAQVGPSSLARFPAEPVCP